MKPSLRDIIRQLILNTTFYHNFKSLSLRIYKNDDLTNDHIIFNEQKLCLQRNEIDICYESCKINTL